jgi:2-polyprenyl-6-methoxyphenol hydroxylase-like FAD-dependent oxidoreductase
LTTPHALISGAGVAGPALAHQLTARGWRTTVVERFPRLRDEGQNVDVRGLAREVARRMGIDDEIRRANTGEVGMRFVRADGSAAASFPVDETGQNDGPTAELEILRGELSRILYERTCDTVEYRFDTRIADLTDHGDYVTATTGEGTTIDADLVVIAEGLRSKTRDFVVPAEVAELGMHFAYLTMPRRETDDQWWNWMHANGSRGVHLRPDNRGTTRAMLTFMSDVRGLETLSRSDQVTILRRTFADLGGPAPRILAELDDAPMYFDAVGQVRVPRWSRGRVTLLGDAAFCNATFGGAGTSLALIGAYVLAGELSRAADHRSSLARYETVMRPFVEATQRVGPGMLRRANPRTDNGIRAIHAAARVVASPPGRAAVNLLFGRSMGTADRVGLPDYPAQAS